MSRSSSVAGVAVEARDPVHEQLRARTRDLHRALEAMLPISAGRVDAATYRDHLQFLLGFYEPLERGLRAIGPLSAHLPDIHSRWKTNALRADLGPWVAAPRARRGQVPDPRSAVQGLGVLYVLEGATLGARTLLPRLRRAGVIPGGIGARYVSGYGRHTAARWKGVRRALDAIPDDHRDEMIAWAVATFESLSGWRSEWERMR